MRKYFPGLDGLRAFAILAVLICHTDVEHGLDGFGTFGTTLFFVLSGFLIGGILIRERDKSATTFGPYWRSFMWRRVLRIFPVYYITLVAYWWLTPHGNVSYWWFVTYAYNWLFSPGNKINPGSLNHTWTLCVEEQFYLLLPWIVWFTPAARRVKTLIAIFFASMALYVVSSGWLPVVTFVFTPCILFAFIAGVLIAEFNLRGDLHVPPIIRKLTWGTCLVYLFGSYLTPNRNYNLILGLVPDGNTSRVLMVALSALLIATALEDPPRLLCLPIIRHIGMISYGIYLWHPLVFYWVDHTIHLPSGDFGPSDLALAGVVVLKFAASYLIAVITWYGFEVWMLRLRDFAPAILRLQTAKYATEQPARSGISGSQRDLHPRASSIACRIHLTSV